MSGPKLCVVTEEKCDSEATSRPVGCGGEGGYTFARPCAGCKANGTRTVHTPAPDGSVLLTSDEVEAVVSVSAEPTFRCREGEAVIGGEVVRVAQFCSANGDAACLVEDLDHDGPTLEWHDICPPNGEHLYHVTSVLPPVPCEPDYSALRIDRWYHATAEEGR